MGKKVLLGVKNPNIFSLSTCQILRTSMGKKGASWWEKPKIFSL
jgi:hypothetical protein